MYTIENKHTGSLARCKIAFTVHIYAMSIDLFKSFAFKAGVASSKCCHSAEELRL